MIKKILGPPGTGKTFTLLNYVKDYIKKGTALHRIGYFAFTRKAAYNARDTFLEDDNFKDVSSNLTKSDLKFFQTLHSFSFHTLGLSEDRVMQPTHYEEIGRLTGVRVKYTKYDEEENNGYLNCDSEYFSLINKARVKDIGIESEFNTNNYSRKIDYTTLNHIKINLKNYRQKNNLIDYTEMINRFIKESNKSPTFDVVFIDEAQDLSPIQWKMFDVLKTKSADIFLAGDDDQAIFEWAGADVKRFINESAEEEILPQSRRVPELVQEYANMIISRIPEERRIKKQWSPRRDDQGNIVKGRAEKINSIDSLDLSEDKWLILGRSKNKLDEIAKKLRTKSLYFETKFGKSYNQKLYRNIVNWTRWTKNEGLTLPETKDVFEYLDKDFNEKQFENQELIKIKDVGFSSDVVWFDAFTKASLNEKLYIRAMLGNGEKLSQDARIKLSTIHTIKGDEEINVIVILDNTNKIRKSVENNPEKQDEEHRVWYVAVTRAKQNLYLLKAKIERRGYRL